MVADRDPDRDPAVEHGVGDDRDAALLDAQHELVVEGVQPGVVVAGGGVAQAHDVAPDRGQALEVGVGVDPVGEDVRQGHGAVHDPTERVGAVGLEGHPHPQRPEAAGERDAVLVEPDLAGRQAARRVGEVLRHDGEGCAVRLFVAHQGEAHVDRGLHPLVEVEREGVGAREPAHGIRLPAEGEEAADGPVDVEPQVLALGEVGDGVEVVERTGVDGSGARDDGEGLEAGGAVGRDHRGEGVEVHREVGRDGDQAQGVGAEAEQLAALAVAAVHLGGGVDGEPPAVRHPVGAQARADAGDPGDRQPDEVGLRRPGDEQPAGVGRVAGGLGAPPHDLLLDEDRRVVRAAEVGVEHAGEEVGEVADRVAGAHDQPQKRAWSLPIE